MADNDFLKLFDPNSYIGTLSQSSQYSPFDTTALQEKLLKASNITDPTQRAQAKQDILTGFDQLNSVWDINEDKAMQESAVRAMGIDWLKTHDEFGRGLRSDLQAQKLQQMDNFYLTGSGTVDRSIGNLQAQKINGEWVTDPNILAARMYDSQSNKSNQFGDINTLEGFNLPGQTWGYETPQGFINSITPGHQVQTGEYSYNIEGGSPITTGTLAKYIATQQYLKDPNATINNYSDIRQKKLQYDLAQQNIENLRSQFEQNYITEDPTAVAQRTEAAKAAAMQAQMAPQKARQEAAKYSQPAQGQGFNYGFQYMGSDQTANQPSTNTNGSAVQQFGFQQYNQQQAQQNQFGRQNTNQPFTKWEV